MARTTSPISNWSLSASVMAGRSCRVNFQNRHVGLRIGADDFGGEFFFVVVGDGHLDFIRAFDDVVGGQNVTVG